MFIEEKIASIKSKYKELYKVDVDIQYNKETGEYILIDDDQDIVKTIKSLDEELLELEKSKSYGDGVYRDYSSESHDGEGRRNNNKIDIYYSNMISVINAINNMAGSVGSVDTSYASSLTGELRAYYDSLGDNTPEAVRNLAGSITGVAAATETCVSLCYNVGKENLKELEELINEFFNQINTMIDTTNYIYDISDEELDKIILKTYFEQSSEIPEDILLNIIKEDKSLTKEDKEYLGDQISKGNIRSSICYLMELNEQKKLDAITKKNNQMIEDLNNEIAELNKKLAVIDNPTNAKRVYPDGTNYGELYKLREEKQAELNRLQREIKQQEKVVRQYNNSRKEWEYDYLLKQVGTDDFEKIISPNEEDVNFYTEALKQYYDNYGAAPYTYLDFESFYAWTDSWLDSDECKLTTKQKEIYRAKLESRDINYSDKDAWNFYLAAKGLANNGYNNENFISTYESQGFNLRYNPLLDKATKYFDDEHIKLYNYIYNTEGKEAADKYLKDFSDSLNKASGYDKASKIFESIINGTNDGYIKGLGVSTLEGIKLGTEQWFDVVGTIFDNSGNLTDSEYAVQYVNQMLSGTSYLQTLDNDLLTYLNNKKIIDEDTYHNYQSKVGKGENLSYGEMLYEIGMIDDASYDKMKDYLNDPDMMKFADQVNDKKGFLGMNRLDWLNTTFASGVSVGNMLPPMIASFATSGVLGNVGVASAGTIGQNVGLSLMFLNSFASSRNESIRDGRSLFESYVYGALSGASEVLTEKFLGGIPGLSNIHNWTELTASNKTGSIIIKSLLNFLVKEPLEEIAEEELQQWIISPAIESIIDGYSTTEFNWDEAVNLAISTYLSTLMLNTGSTLTNTIGTINASNEVVSYTLEDGSNISLKYGQLMDCMDVNGKLDVDKLNQITGKKHTTSGLKMLTKVLLLPLMGMGIVGTVSTNGVGVNTYATTNNYRTVSNVINFINNKYGDNSAIRILTDYLQTGNDRLITRDGNCRQIILSIPINELKNILAQIKNSYAYNVQQRSGNKYNSVGDVVGAAKSKMGYVDTVSKIEQAVNYARIHNMSVYSALVSMNTYKSKTLPTSFEVAKYKSRFDNGKYLILPTQRGVFSHISTFDFYSKSGRITDRLYINTSSCSDTINFVTMFADICEKRGIPFYFKTADMFYGVDKIKPDQLNRDESIVIYSDSYHISDYVNICNEIRKKTGMKLEVPPLLTGVVDDFIGYGKEPNIPNESFNSLRSKLLDNTISEVNENLARQYGVNISNPMNLNNFINWIRSDSQRYNYYLSKINQKIYENCPKYGINRDAFFLNSN